MKTTDETASKTTFICDNDGCDNEKTQYNSLYCRHKNHYCSLKCHNEAKTIKMHQKPTHCKDCKKKIPEDEIEQLVTKKYSTNCKDCRELRRQNQKNTKLQKENDFRQRFKQMEWRK